MNILLVEDSQGHPLAPLLSTHSTAHGVIHTRAGRELDAALSDLKVDNVVVLNLTEPQLNGAELISTLRSNHPLVGLIAVGCEGEAQGRLKAYDSGADIYLQTPLDGIELIAAVESLSRRIVIQKRRVNQAGTQEQVHGT